MPYKSKKQEAYFNANRKKMESQGVDVDEWNKASKGLDLPEKTDNEQRLRMYRRRKRARNAKS